MSSLMLSCHLYTAVIDLERDPWVQRNPPFRVKGWIQKIIGPCPESHPLAPTNVCTVSNSGASSLRDIICCMYVRVCSKGGVTCTWDEEHGTLCFTLDLQLYRQRLCSVLNDVHNLQYQPTVENICNSNLRMVPWYPV